MNKEPSDIAELFRLKAERSKAKRERNRSASARLLQEAGIVFERRNNGAHLIVHGATFGLYDFWPGTGLWIHRQTKKQGRGVAKLIQKVRPD